MNFIRYFFGLNYHIRFRFRKGEVVPEIRFLIPILPFNMADCRPYAEHMPATYAERPCKSFEA